MSTSPESALHRQLRFIFIFVLILMYEFDPHLHRTSIPWSTIGRLRQESVDTCGRINLKVVGRCTEVDRTGNLIEMARRALKTVTGQPICTLSDPRDQAEIFHFPFLI